MHDSGVVYGLVPVSTQMAVLVAGRWRVSGGDAGTEFISFPQRCAGGTVPGRVLDVLAGTAVCTARGSSAQSCRQVAGAFAAG